MPCRSEGMRAIPRIGLIAALFALCVTTSLSADTIRVAVASNFAPALRALQPDFERASGHSLSLSSGSSGSHYAQIRQGAPYAVFLAADAQRPRLLEEEGIAVADSRFTYALGRLALWIPESKTSQGSPGDAAGTPLPAQLRALPARRLAIANPRLAPYGAAAEAYLRHEGLWETIQPDLVMGENVAQAFQFVASGAVPAGLVALSQLRVLERQEVRVPQDEFMVIDPALYPQIRQQAVLLIDSPATREFLAWLKSVQVRTELVGFGYDMPHVER